MTTLTQKPEAPPDLPATAALFLDFDGTLAPVAARPQDVLVPGWVVPVLRGLAERSNGALAIVSGRPIEQIDAFLQPLHLPAAGAHGAERRRHGGPVEVRRAAIPAPVLAMAYALVQQHDGLILETKSSGFSLHFRARPELEAPCALALGEALAADPALAEPWQLQRGHCVFELKERAVSKGTALVAFMAEPPFAGRLPVFVGDDTTDEDGIAAAQAAGGFGVRVGAGASAARHRLADTEAVRRWLGAALAPTEAGR